MANLRVSLLCLGMLTLGCGSGSPASRAKAPEMPTEQTKCKIAAGSENPLVTEWPASEKANLEARLREGGVVVQYGGCEMKLLPQCRVRGRYGWRRTTTATDTLEIRDADELYAKLPLGAVQLEGELARSGRLAVQTTVSGQLELSGHDFNTVERDRSCDGATHIVGALSVGAFKLRSGGTVRAGGGVGVMGAGAGAKTQSSETVMREAGDPAVCGQATEQAPNPECGSPIQIFLRPLPKTLRDRAPEGTMKVAFATGETDTDWEVMVGDRTLCKTPCEKFIDPVMPVSMVHDAGFLQQDHVVDVPDLREHQADAPLTIKAHKRKTGLLVLGINGATFGGLATAGGIAFLAIGCPSEDKKGLCTAGAITLPLGAALLGLGIYAIVNSGSRAEIVPQTGLRMPSEFGVGGKF